jgi:glycosyltransferase involved in cell wall biosynthesis
MRLGFILPGFHRYQRGAEIALLSVANELAQSGDEVTVIGSGEPIAGTPYRFLHAGSIRRETFEHFPFFPPVRSETAYEEASFIPGLLMRYKPNDFDAVLTCSFPFTNMLLRRPVLRGEKPAQIFVTQNGDWPARSNDTEYRFFGCDGLVCTNPDYMESNKDRWNCALIPNGIAVSRFHPGNSNRARFGLPQDVPIILMVSAFIPTKRVEDGIRAVAKLDTAHLVVAGDGPLRDTIKKLAAEILPDRFTQISVGPDDMPDLYRSADVFLHMSKLESFGNVFPEAMACGLPIVGHDTPRLRWIVGDDEHLVDTENLDSVAAAITAALVKRSNPGDAISARAASFDWRNIADQYRTFIRRVVAKKQRQ